MFSACVHYKVNGGEGGIIRTSFPFSPHPSGRRHLCLRFPSQKPLGNQTQLVLLHLGFEFSFKLRSLNLILFFVE